MASHGAESTDWINVLFAQVMQGYRNDMLAGGGEEGAKLRVEKWLNPEGGRTSWLVRWTWCYGCCKRTGARQAERHEADSQDPIEVTSMSLGTAYPLFSNARIRPADAQGRIVCHLYQ
jgi:maintenance of morphology protein 1